MIIVIEHCIRFELICYHCTSSVSIPENEGKYGKNYAATNTRNGSKIYQIIQDFKLLKFYTCTQC